MHSNVHTSHYLLPPSTAAVIGRACHASVRSTVSAIEAAERFVREELRKGPREGRELRSAHASAA
jgi:hypothetical protein